MDFAALPTEILPSLDWSFTGSLYVDRDEFVSEVNEWLGETPASGWRPDEVILGVPRVLVTYPNASDMGEETVELVSGNGECFTAADLLFQLHNAIVDDVGDLDHHFFEGLKLNSLPVAGSPPLYLLSLGS